MSNLDVSTLLNALENETNTSIMNLTSSRIKDIKNNVLQSLQMERKLLKSFHKKLKSYRYCSDMKDLQFGFYIRWIPLKNPDAILLTNGGIIIDIDIINNCIPEFQHIVIITTPFRKTKIPTCSIFQPTEIVRFIF